jgi:hypothetical protein
MMDLLVNSNIDFGVTSSLAFDALSVAKADSNVLKKLFLMNESQRKAVSHACEKRLTLI